MSQAADEELERLWAGSLQDLPAEADLLVQPAGDPELTLRRSREVMATVIGRYRGPWPELQDWPQVLPDWFTASMVDDAEIRNCVLDRWSFRAWVYWMRPDTRPWRWWGADASPEEVRVAVLPLSRPYLNGALRWLLEVAARA